MTPSRRRISASAERPVAETCPMMVTAWSGLCAAVYAAPSASAIITAMLWATMSCISRVILDRSAAAASRASWSRSRSSRSARSTSEAR
jgi:hypothetical protein